MAFRKVKDLVKSLHNITSRRMNTIDNICKKGCSYCCSQIPSVHEAESLLIADYIEYHMTKKDKEQLKQKVIHWLDHLMAHTPDRILTTRDIIRLERSTCRKGIMCPFLKNSLCLIYKVRPMACRTFSVNDDVKLCIEQPDRDCDPIAYNLFVVMISRLKQQSGTTRSKLLVYATAEALGIKHKLRTIT